jgi:hypothetical protein
MTKVSMVQALPAHPFEFTSGNRFFGFRDDRKRNWPTPSCWAGRALTVLFLKAF